MNNPNRSMIVCLFLVAVSPASYGQTSSAAYKSICITPGAAPDPQKFWSGLLTLNPISPPSSVWLEPHLNKEQQSRLCKPWAQTEDAKVGEIRSSNPDRPKDAFVFATYSEMLAHCGYANSLKIAMSLDPMIVDANKGAFCKTKLPHCKQIKAARETADAIFLGSNSAGSAISPGSYELKLDSISFDSFSNFTSAQTDDEKQGRIWMSFEAENLSVTCGAVAPKPPQPLKLTIPETIRLGGDAAAVTLKPGIGRKLEDVAAIELGLKFDRENRTKTGEDGTGKDIVAYDDFVKFKGAIGVRPIEWFANESKSKAPNAADPVTTLFASLNYDEKFDPTKETDNLAVGVYHLTDWAFINNRYVGDPQFKVSWVTDIEERESAQWTAQATVPLTFLDRFGPTHTIGPLTWSVDAILDYSHVIDEGDKIALKDVGEVFRMGYQIDWQVNRPLINLSGFEPTLKGKYHFRDTLGGGRGNADLVEVELGLFNLKTHNATISIDYNRGENLTSLEPVENYSLSLKFRQ